MNTRIRNPLHFVLSAAVLFSACERSPGPLRPPSPGMPKVGQTEFVSAGAQNGERSQNGGADAGAAAPTNERASDESGDPRTVEEGDIYRVASAGRILNLNAYRGLQIIDVGDPTDPHILGRLPITGTPVELYTVGTRVYVLLNNWRGYYGTRTDVRPELFEGGLVLAVDASDPANPVETGRAEVPGWIRTSRLTRGGGQEALFVVATNGDHTTVKSFTVSAQGALSARTEIDLGGYVTDVQATPDRLLVARTDWTRGSGRSQVGLIDIGDPTGAMIEGANVDVQGLVSNKYNMDLRGDVLRVVSANSWGSTSNTNHVETFDATDIQTPAPIDHETFGPGEQLFGTLFLEDRAFFVTYERRDPFHAFAIDAAGHVEEMSQFIVSGWNDYFRAVAGDTRIIGIGKDDQNGQRLAVSLYDITDLTNAQPLITRANIDLTWAWSEASWDDRAFSILEGATSIAATNGAIETGLVLLPFSGWDQATGFRSGVQIFTFSSSTLTRRGVMEQTTPVRRSFVVDPANHTTGNLSEEELSLFDTSDPEAPIELARLELAPNYSGILVFGAYGVRRHSKDFYARYWGGHQGPLPEDDLEVINLAGNVDAAIPLASISVRSDARIFKVGDRLAAVTIDPIDATVSNPSTSPTYQTTITVHDLAIPTSPQLIGSLTTTELSLGGGYYYGGIADCLNCGRGYWYGGDQRIQVVGDALVFVEENHETELEGNETARSIYPANPGYERCWQSTTGQIQACTYYTGGIDCRSLTRIDGTVEPEVCTGDLYECNQSGTGESSCVVIDASTVSTTEYTYTYERYRYWMHHDFRAMDVAALALGPEVAMGQDEEGSSLVVDGSTLYATYKIPVDVPNDPRPFVQYYFKAIEFSNPLSPVVGASINIPGELIEVEGNQIVTRDFLWGSNIVESSIDKLEIQNGLAYLQAVRVFSDRVVEKVKLDGEGHVLVSHGRAWSAIPNAGVASTREADAAPISGGGSDVPEQPLYKLTVLDFVGPNLDALSEVDIDAWASLEGGIAGRALFTIPGGLLVVNLDDATAPYAQAYFPVNAWSMQIELAGREALFAGGRFGLYKFDLDVFNLLPAAVTD